jgi:hypothetical protein
MDLGRHSLGRGLGKGLRSLGKGPGAEPLGGSGKGLGKHTLGSGLGKGLGCLDESPGAGTLVSAALQGGLGKGLGMAVEKGLLSFDRGPGKGLDSLGKGPSKGLGKPSGKGGLAASSSAACFLRRLRLALPRSFAKGTSGGVASARTAWEGAGSLQHFCPWSGGSSLSRHQWHLLQQKPPNHASSCTKKLHWAWAQIKNFLLGAAAMAHGTDRLARAGSPGQEAQDGERLGWGKPRTGKGIIRV